MRRGGPLGFLFAGRKQESEPHLSIDAVAQSRTNPVPPVTEPEKSSFAIAETLFDGLYPDATLEVAPSSTDCEPAKAPLSHPVAAASPASPPRGKATGGSLSAVEEKLALRSPVFIVGSPRSGTSILINGLLAAGYNGFREGNFLPLMRVFEAAADRHRASFGGGSDKVMATLIRWDTFKDEIFSVFKKHVDALNTTSPWMDKSGNPEMIEAIPQLLKLWPSAVFIFAKRRGIENINSRLKKFPGLSFEYHCRDWAKNMSAWSQARDLLGARGLEVDQQEIIRSPDEVASKLGKFLRASDEAQERIRETFTRERPQETDVGSAARIIDLERAGWTNAQKDTFLKLCWPAMIEFGYSSSDSYWADNRSGEDATILGET